ncbi:hypothetical protein GN956_G13414 [Arapaima gigas]
MLCFHLRFRLFADQPQVEAVQQEGTLLRWVLVKVPQVASAPPSRASAPLPRWIIRNGEPEVTPGSRQVPTPQRPTWTTARGEQTAGARPPRCPPGLARGSEARTTGARGRLIDGPIEKPTRRKPWK